MAQPITSPKAREGSLAIQNDRVVTAAAWSVGGRPYMQDSFSLGLNHIAKGKPVDFVGIFDGHGRNGENVSRVVAKYLCEQVLKEYEQEENFEKCIEATCFNLDNAIKHAPEMKDKDDGFVYGGSTCCCLWIKESTIYVCNVGDSRCVLSYGENHNAIQVSADQKPTTRKEVLRIRQAGGTVENRRVNGGLGVARSFGDFKYKDNPKLRPWEQLVIVMPDIYTVVLDPRINFLLLASDGVWDKMTSQEAVANFVLASEAGLPCNAACAKVVSQCISPTSDNTTLVAILVNAYAEKERNKHTAPKTVTY